MIVRMEKGGSIVELDVKMSLPVRVIARRFKVDRLCLDGAALDMNRPLRVQGWTPDHILTQPEARKGAPVIKHLDYHSLCALAARYNRIARYAVAKMMMTEAKAVKPVVAPSVALQQYYNEIEFNSVMVRFFDAAVARNWGKAAKVHSAGLAVEGETMVQCAEVRTKVLASAASIEGFPALCAQCRDHTPSRCKCGMYVCGPLCKELLGGPCDTCTFFNI